MSITNCYFPCKIQVNSHEECKAIQEWLFEQGCLWSGEITQRVELLDSRQLYVSDDKKITWSDNYLFYQNHLAPELKFCFEKELKVKCVNLVTETVELNGKKYRKEDLEAVLQKLTPVGE